MSDMDTRHVDDVLHLAALLRPTWPTIDARIAASGHPTNEGDADGGDPGDSAGDGADEQAGGDGGGEQADPKAEAEKWKALARKHEKNAKANAAAAKKLQEVEDAKKSETERAAEKATQAEQRATSAEAKALRLEVALDKAPDGMSLAQVRKLAKRLSGSTQEELEADAEELFADFQPSAASSGDPGRGRPRERLRPGSAPADTSDDDGETDPSKLAAKVPRQFS
ncbi:hypothetical protein [Patulibacter sp. SYSU D01012]|uniref:hypothetical protein n=1 Tax=Patulibacter sp. SYSU D01012 TaxID=2817381 RepID=UPI001B312512|nr:hypothetical protein [Patulibacter sp. SYSU D01012]